MATNKTPAPDRVAPTNDDETLLYATSLRRCAFCFGLNKDHDRKRGQIAHIDKNRSNSVYKNLAWLCLDHHDEYDGKTSQSKNLTRKELEHFLEELYSYNAKLPVFTRERLQEEAKAEPVAPALPDSEVEQIRAFLKEHKGFFEYVFYEREHLAFALRSDAQDTFDELRMSWGEWNSYDKRVRDVQVRLRQALNAIYATFDAQSYDLHGNYIKFNKAGVPYGTFEKKREALKPLIEQLETVLGELDNLAIQ